MQKPQVALSKPVWTLFLTVRFSVTVLSQPARLTVWYVG